MINIKMQPADVQKLSPHIAVIGVGGAGGNAVNNMIASGLEGCEFLVCNTDAQALENSKCDYKIQLGASVTGGLGAGSRPDIGRTAAEETLDDIMQHLDGANMAFVTAGMGGGTGTGAAPVIAKACREKGILTVGVVTKPFHFEGSHRMKQAEEGIREMQGYVDTLIVIPNQNLFRVANESTTFAEAFKLADSVLQSGVRGVTDLMVKPGLVNLDFADIRTAMQEMGKAMLGTGEAEGEKRAVEAAESAINNPLLDDISMKGAHGVIINVTGGFDMTLFEADEACNRIRDEVDPNANIIFGATFDEGLEGKMRVSIVATGIEKEAVRKTIGGAASALTERATPTTIDAPEEGKKAEDAPKATAPERAVNALTGIAAVRNITAPVVTVTEPEAEMFEQSEFTAPAQEAVGAVAPGPAQNTALRGTRYKDSFIPPAPVKAEQPPAPPPGFHGARQAEAASGSGLKLNPPKMPAAQEMPKRSPSLFERITGSVQNQLGLGDNAGSGTEPAPRTPPALAEGGPAQGKLNIESPSEKPKGEGDLDIPAFLRRQAN